ncbi:MAG: DNA-processing protein DprA [Lachnospiraceae bacterium]|nr:DNA-processing protein DprA [Lachnospiraceae bacterium]
MTDIYNEARWLALSKFFACDAKKADKLTEHFGSTECLFCAEKDEIMKLDFLKPEIAEKLYETIKIEPLEEMGRMSCMGIEFYSRDHPLFPKGLLRINPVPIGLFVKGSLPSEEHRAIAVVGSRTSSNYGRSCCEMFCREFAKAGIDVISGMALGIDTAAHEGSLKGGGKTYAVLGCGVDICYPRSNELLYDELIERGGIISEFYPGTQPQSYNFPIRNRIIAGLSDAVLAVEARSRSGTLITVGCALDQGKEVFAFPGRITDKLSEGCNRLISIGASPALDPKEMIEQIGKLPHRALGEMTEKEYNTELMKRPVKVFNEGEKVSKIEAEEARKVFLALGVEPKCIDEISESTGFDAGRVLEILVSLELEGFIKQAGPCMYVQNITK